MPGRGARPALCGDRRWRHPSPASEADESGRFSPASNWPIALSSSPLRRKTIAEIDVGGGCRRQQSDRTLAGSVALLSSRPSPAGRFPERRGWRRLQDRAARSPCNSDIACSLASRCTTVATPKIVVGLGGFRPERDRALQMNQRGSQISLLAENETQQVVRLRMSFIERQALR